jgi:tRNA U34 2-thiouridine synthase MnmA/TrmU
MSDINKVVLAYSGGLDTSVIVRWLQETYQCEVVTFTADLGQGEEVEPARAKAEALGVKEIYIEDLREEFVSEYVFPMFRANTIYEGEYLLGTSIARPLIAKRLVEIAEETGADAISHGATGIVSNTISLLSKNAVRSHHIRWMRTSFTSATKAQYWRILGPSLRKICGVGQFLQKLHRIKQRKSY